MGTHLIVDRGACAGHGLCYGAAPEILDCDDQGDPVITVDPLPEELVGRAREVIELCPERALTLDHGR
jgi:ferredoxin